MRRPGVLLAAVILATLTWVAGAGPAVPPCAAAGGNRAALVVEHGNGSVVQRCVAFDGASIGGVDLLDASGLRWSGQTFSEFGQAVCAIDGEPATYSSCPGGDRYWALFLLRAGGSWKLSAVGISSLSLADGDANGFRYEPSSGIAAAPPAPEPCPAAVTAPPTAPGGAPTNPAPGPATVPAPASAAPTAVPPSASASAAASGGPAATISSSAAPSVGGPSPTASSPPGSPNPGESGTAGSGGGLDPGLLAAVVGIGVLGCFALVRLAARQRTTR
jgi:hypothetical protein